MAQMIHEAWIGRWSGKGYVVSYPANRCPVPAFHGQMQRDFDLCAGQYATAEQAERVATAAKREYHVLWSTDDERFQVAVVATALGDNPFTAGALVTGAPATWNTLGSFANRGHAELMAVEATAAAIALTDSPDAFAVVLDILSR